MTKIGFDNENILNCNLRKYSTEYRILEKAISGVWWKVV